MQGYFVVSAEITRDELERDAAAEIPRNDTGAEALLFLASAASLKRACDEDEESEPLAKRGKLGEDAAKMLVCDESVDPCEQDEDTAS